MSPELDPLRMADWQIAEAAEARMKTVYELAEELAGLPPRNDGTPS